jgi:hypothetical protein
VTDFLSWDAGGSLVTTTCEVISGWEDEITATLTANPIEDGSNVNDHHAVAPRKLTIRIAHSQTPLNSDQSLLQKFKFPIRKSQFQPSGLFALTTLGREAVGAVVGALGGALGFGQDEDGGIRTYIQPNASSDPANELHDKLVDAIKNGYVCTVTLGVNRNSEKLYEGFVMTRLLKSHTSEEGELARFEVSLEEINVVKTEAAALPIPSPLEAAAALASKIVKGKQNPTIRDQPPAEKEKTLAKMIKDGALGSLSGP